MNIVIVGGIAAGMSVAAKAKRTQPDAKITVIEQESYISFGACGLPYYLGKQFDDAKVMFARTPEQMIAAGIDMKTNHKACSVDYQDKQVTVLDLKTNQTIKLPYDRLVIATGAVPIMPPISGLQAKNVHSLTKLSDAQAIKQQLKPKDHVTIIGGGFIGLEVAEQLAHLGYQVTIVEGEDRVMSAVFDEAFSKRIESTLQELGICVKTGSFVQSLAVSSDHVHEVYTEQEMWPTDQVIVATGVRPNTDWCAHELLKRLDNGAICIDMFGRTSIPDVFSVGDCATIEHLFLEDAYIPLATGANRLGRIVGVNCVLEPKDWEAYPGSLGSSAIKIGDKEAGITGLTEQQAQRLGLDINTVTIQAPNHSDYVPGQEEITIKAVYDRQTRMIYGVQVFGGPGAVMRLSAFTTAIYAQVPIDDLGFYDFVYAPPFSTPWDPINIIGNVAT